MLDLEKHGYKVQQKIGVQTMPLGAILDKNLVPNQPIDFMNIDAEGLDLEVLKSNNWLKYRPSVIAVEDGDFDIENKDASSIYRFLKEKEYTLVAFMQKTLIFSKAELLCMHQ